MHCKTILLSAAIPVMMLLALSSCNPNSSGRNNNDSLSQKVIIQKPGYIPPLAADSGYTPPDRSPMDMSYFPADYPMQRMNGADTLPPLARVIYSRPQKNGREVFGNSDKSLCHYGKEWRLGANEATEIEFFKPVTIKGKSLPAGRYVLYCIPYEDKWVMVFNSGLYTWGLHIDASKDIFRIELPVNPIPHAVEVFTMQFEPAGSNAKLVMAWDNVQTEMPVNF